MKKAKEDIASTKQVGGDDVRKGHPGGDKSHREHPHKNEGYKSVGKPSKQGRDDARGHGVKTDRNPGRHPHQGR